jgi:uncharacterized protein YfaS (alpha-2-macroglobulin family)
MMLRTAMADRRGVRGVTRSLGTMRLAVVLVVALTALVGGPVASPVDAQPSPRIVDFSPQGTVKQVRQVRARFSDPMASLGDPRPAADVFDITCSEPGTPRWIDSREWVHDFVRDLPAGVRCAFRLRAGVTTLDGRPVTAAREFAFSTGGPAVRRAMPYEGSSWIDETQAFVLMLDAAVTERSVLDHVHFAVDGVGERVPVRIVTGADREAILKSRRLADDDRPMLVVQARRRFPSGARVRLVWGRGVATPGGVATTEDQVLAYGVRRAFTVIFRCERERAGVPCLPVSSMMATFSGPVPWEQAKRLALVGPGGRRWLPEARDPGEALHHGVTFKGPFPESAKFQLLVPADLKDDAGRTPINADRFPLDVRTGAFPPLAKFSARFGILERADPVLPVTVRRIEPEIRARLARVDESGARGMRRVLERVKATVFRIPPGYSGEIQPWLRRVVAAERHTSVFGPVSSGPPAIRNGAARTFDVPRPGGADAFEVVGIPLDTPGLYVVELESQRLGEALLGKAAPMYVPTAALVTNLAAHLKWGGDQALVWVTSLDRARPVGGARVTVHDCDGKVLWQGQADGSGLARVTGLPVGEALRRCEMKFGDDGQQAHALQGLGRGLFVVAQTADDLTFVSSSWDDGIERWRFGLPEPDWQGPNVFHTVFDRALFRAGETVHMKHLARVQTMGGFAAVPAGDRPAQAIVRHVGSDAKHELPLAWREPGVAETAWAIPRDARLGQWEVVVTGTGTPRYGTRRVDMEWTTGAFRVEEFTVPLMRAALRPPSQPRINAAEVPLDVAVGYLAGGGARGLPVTVRTQVLPRSVPEFEGFEGFTFANGAVAEGIKRTAEDDDEEPATDGPRATPAVHQRLSLTLDQAGTGRATITGLPRAATPRDLLAEVEFRDPAGEVQTVAQRIPLWPARRLVGLRTVSSEVFGDKVSAHVAATDLAGRPLVGARVAVDVFERKLYSHRKRLVGGFYAYEHVQETRRRVELCAGETGPGGVFVCEGAPGVTGHLVLVATARDEDGNAISAHGDVWVVDPEAWWWFDVKDSDRIDVLPERRRYEPGETARFQVRMPFREATALVTVEREGVADAFVTPLAGESPTIEVPVRGEHAPNVFVSVMVVRGRVGGVQPTALVDLGRPAFKVGVAEVRVGWRAHELKVAVTSERSTYRVRERVPVRIRVRTADGAVPAGGEVAVAAVDEGLLELAPNRSWDALAAMMHRRGHGVLTSTAQGQVIGKRHFGLKALPQGGGGGRQVTREMFDTLLLWQPRVALDAQGEATVEVPLNDSLTAFRIVAVATSGVAMFGTGALTVRSTQDLMILPGIPPLVREGDRVQVEVTVRNTTAGPLDVTVTARAAGLAGALPPRPVALAAGEARAVTWEVAVPVGRATIDWEIGAAAAAGPADRTVVVTKVVPAVPVRTYAATLLQWDPAAGSVRQPVERPADAAAGRGGVEVTLRPSLLDGAEALRERMRTYPYTCLEQEVSRAVALRDAARWQQVADALPAHLDRDGLLKFFPQMTWGSEVLTAYVLAIAHEAGWALPGAPRQRMERGLRGFVEGKVARRSEVPSPDLTLRKLAAIAALARGGRADAALLASLRVEPTLWPTAAVLDWWRALRRIDGAPDRATRLAEVQQVLRARLNQQGTTIGVSAARGDAMPWLMVSADVNAVRLLLEALDAGVWNDDIPRLVRGALARQQRGAWDLTTANAWGVLALERFSRAFERDPVAGTTRVTLGDAARALEWADAPKGGALGFGWPPAVADVVAVHQGAGRPWIAVQARAAIPLRSALSTGYRITRTVTPVESRQPGRWWRGDLVRVRLEIDAQADMPWVVVSDPVPGGASHIGRGLARESTIAAGRPGPGALAPAFEERSFEAYRAYFAWMPKGPHVIEYTLRLNQAGRFGLPATRVEAMYAPEMFGEIPNAAWEVAP